MSNLTNKVVIITGASSGIGEATALALADEGMRVVLAARRADRLDALAKQIEREGGRALPIEADVTDRTQVQRLIEQTVEKFGAIDALINNAGVMPVSPIAACRFDDWDRMIDVNIKGALYAMGFVLPVMLEHGSGHIVNISSIAGRHVFPGNSVYCGTKHMLHVVSEGLRQELAQADPPVHGIRVTIIAPGIVMTELPESSTDPDARARIREYYDNTPNGLQTKDIARAIVFALDSPAHVNVNELLIRPVAQVR